MGINNTVGRGTYRDKRFRESEKNNKNVFNRMLLKVYYALLNGYSVNIYIKNSLLEDRCMLPQVRLMLLEDRLMLPRVRLMLLEDRLMLPRVRCTLPRVRLMLPRVRCTLPRVRCIYTLDRCTLPVLSGDESRFNGSKDMFYSMYINKEYMFVNLN